MCSNALTFGPNHSASGLSSRPTGWVTALQRPLLDSTLDFRQDPRFIDGILIYVASVLPHASIANLSSVYQLVQLLARMETVWALMLSLLRTESAQEVNLSLLSAGGCRILHFDVIGS